MNNTKKIIVTVKNIGNGFATNLAIQTRSNFSGLAYKKVISIGEFDTIGFDIDLNELAKGINFEIQYIDAITIEYMQIYTITNNAGQIKIE